MFYRENIFNTATTTGNTPGSSPTVNRSPTARLIADNRVVKNQKFTKEDRVLSFLLKGALRSVEFIFGCFSTFAVIYNLNLKLFDDKIVKYLLKMQSYLTFR